MAQYNYPDPNPSANIVNMALAIEKAGLAVPDGMIRSGDIVGVIYATDLSAGQKTTLDTVMGVPTTGNIPVTLNTVYTVDDILDFRSTFRANLASAGISFDIYISGPSQYKLIFNKVLTNANKNTVQSEFLKFYKQVQ